MLDLRFILITCVPCAADAAIQTKRLMSKLFLGPGPVLFASQAPFSTIFLESKNSKIINSKILMSWALSWAKTRTFLQAWVFLSHFLATQKPANYTMLSARNARNHFLSYSWINHFLKEMTAKKVLFALLFCCCLFRHLDRKCVGNLSIFLH